MNIDRKLNLVIPVDHADGQVYYVHVRPLLRIVFEQNYKLIGKVFNQLYTEGLGISNARVAFLALKSVAEEEGNLDKITRGLIAEMHRSVMVLAPNTDGLYDSIPWPEAIAKNLLDEDDVAEVDNVVTFFMVLCCMHRKSELPVALDLLAGMYQAQLSSLMPTAFASSLKTSTTTEPTGPRETLSSIPV